MDEQSRHSYTDTRRYKSTYKSMDGPWLLWQSVFPYDHILVIYLRNPMIPAIPNVGFHHGQISPIFSLSAYTDTKP